MMMNKYKRAIALWGFILIGAFAGYSSLFHKKPENQTPVAVPEKKSPITTATIQKSHVPSVLQPPPTTQKIQQWTTSAGTRVYLIESHSIPMVDIHMTFDAGSARDGAQFGVANCWLNLLDQGTSTLNADQIAEQFENKGALLNAHVDRDRAMISLRTLSEPEILNPLLNLLADLMAKPAFKEESIALIKNQILTEQKMMQQQPEILAKNAFYEALYSNHPYAHPVIGTEQTVQAITQSDLQHFHQQYAVAQNATLTLVGDLTLEQAKTLSEKIIQQLPQGSKAPDLKAIPPLTTPIVQTIHYASEQTHLLMGGPGIANNDPDYFPLLIANYILGDNILMSRLFKEVREKRGLVYHVRSHFATLKQPGPFVIKLQTQNHQIQEAIQVVKETLGHFVNEGPSEQELIDAKQGLMQAFPLSLNSNEKLSAQLDTLSFYEQPLDFLETYQSKIKAVTLEDIQAALQKHIHPETMALITVGPQSP